MVNYPGHNKNLNRKPNYSFPVKTLGGSEGRLTKQGAVFSFCVNLCCQYVVNCPVCSKKLNRKPNYRFPARTLGGSEGRLTK